MNHRNRFIALIISTKRGATIMFRKNNCLNLITYLVIINRMYLSTLPSLYRIITTKGIDWKSRINESL